LPLYDLYLGNSDEHCLSVIHMQFVILLVKL